MKINCLTSLITVLVVGNFSVNATEPDNIVNIINASGVITVTQPEALKLRNDVEPVGEPVKDNAGQDDDIAISDNPQAPAAQPANTKKITGYRIQVFSDNTPAKAKGEARSKAREVGAAFPQYRAYVVFTAPYWRVRIGDFRSQEEAENVASQIKKRFPELSREVRVVRDRINVTK